MAIHYFVEHDDGMVIALFNLLVVMCCAVVVSALAWCLLMEMVEDMNMKQHYETDEQFDSGTYKAKSYTGIAWWILGWETEPDEDTEWSGYENRTGNVVAIMVGDDRHFVFEPDELIAIDDDAFCHGCGQIGCSHYQ